jgi:hypothetical protein
MISVVASVDEKTKKKKNGSRGCFKILASSALGSGRGRLVIIAGSLSHLL